MAELRVWVQSTSVTEPTKVTVAGDSDVDDLKEAAIKKFKIPYAAPYCSIKLSEDGETVIVSAKVKDLPCGHDVNSPLLLVLPREEGSTITYFQMKAKYFGAKKIKGIRASVYRHAQAHLAYYSLDYSRSIWYDEGSENLQISLLFTTERDALRFRSFLEHWYLDNPMVVKSGHISVEKDIAVVHVPISNKVKAVQLCDYDPGDSESPVQSLGMFQASSSSVSSTCSAVNLDDPLFKYQCLERPQEFYKLRSYCCYLKSRSKFPKLVNDPNNELAGTWCFHQWLDGTNTQDDVPILALKPLTDSFEPVMLPGPPPIKRSRVDIIIEFRESNDADFFVHRLKDGSTRISEKQLQTYVHVSDAATFCDCLKWKYEDTIKRWNGDEDSSHHS